jgi:hypothetical protein
MLSELKQPKINPNNLTEGIDIINKLNKYFNPFMIFALYGSVLSGNYGRDIDIICIIKDYNHGLVAVERKRTLKEFLESMGYETQYDGTSSLTMIYKELPNRAAQVLDIYVITD